MSRKMKLCLIQIFSNIVPFDNCNARESVWKLLELNHTIKIQTLQINKLVMKNMAYISVIAIKNFTNVQKLELDFKYTQNKDISKLCFLTLTKLKELKLLGGIEGDITKWISLKELKDLVLLDVSKTKITGNVIEWDFLSFCTKLKIFRIHV